MCCVTGVCSLVTANGIPCDPGLAYSPLTGSCEWPDTLIETGCNPEGENWQLLHTIQYLVDLHVPGFSGDRVRAVSAAHRGPRPQPRPDLRLALPQV